MLQLRSTSSEFLLGGLGLRLFGPVLGMCSQRIGLRLRHRLSRQQVTGARWNSPQMVLLYVSREGCPLVALVVRWLAPAPSSVGLRSPLPSRPAFPDRYGPIRLGGSVLVVGLLGVGFRSLDARLFLLLRIVGVLNLHLLVGVGGRFRVCSSGTLWGSGGSWERRRIYRHNGHEMANEPGPDE